MWRGSSRPSISHYCLQLFLSCCWPDRRSVRNTGMGIGTTEKFTLVNLSAKMFAEVEDTNTRFKASVAVRMHSKTNMKVN